MRWITAALLSVLAQAPAANLPPAYPRAGVSKLLDNESVQVWNIAWLKGAPAPLHRHIYDLVGVYYGPGDRIIVSTEGARRPVSTKAWDIAFQRTGVTHAEEGASDAPLRAVFVEIKRPGPYGMDTGGGGTAAFPAEAATQKLDNDRVIVWEFMHVPAAKPHRPRHDAIVVAIGGQPPRATWVARGTEHRDEAAANATRVYVFEIK